MSPKIDMAAAIASAALAVSFTNARWSIQDTKRFKAIESDVAQIKTHLNGAQLPPRLDSDLYQKGRPEHVIPPPMEFRDRIPGERYAPLFAKKPAIQFGMFKSKPEKADQRNKRVSIHRKAKYTDKQKALLFLEATKAAAEQPKKLARRIKNSITAGMAVAGTLAGAAIGAGVDPHSAHKAADLAINAVCGGGASMTGDTYKDRLAGYFTDQIYKEDHYPSISDTEETVTKDIAQNRRRPSLENIHFFNEDGRRRYADITSKKAQELRDARYYRDQNRARYQEAKSDETDPSAQSRQRKAERHHRHHVKSMPAYFEYDEEPSYPSLHEKTKQAKKDMEASDQSYSSKFRKVRSSFRTD
jgi:hypothetical protein